MKKIMQLFLLTFFIVQVVNAQDVVVTADITSNTTWTSSNTYILDGLIFVDSSYTLTIEAGTVIKGRLSSNITTGDGASALVVRRYGKIIADGTANAPIIFTSELDDISVSDDLDENDKQLWGGVIVLGNATTNQPTTENQIEGINNDPARYGGTNDEDSSGVIRYVSIRHGGYSISGIAGDEINGLTLGAVGSKTVIEYVEIFANFDDGVEWFGGTVNMKYLVAAFCGDDSFDWDQGFRGKGQFWFVIQSPLEAGRGGEHDGGDDNETGNPYAIPEVSNATYIGSGMNATGVAGDGNDRCLYFRDNSGGKYSNSIFTEYVGIGVKIEDLASGEDSRSRLENGDLVLSNNYWFNFGGAADVTALMNGDDFAAAHFNSNSNSFSDPQIINIDWTKSNLLDPRIATASPAASGASIPSGGFFSSVGYRGAFDPANNSLWTDGWTAIDEYGFTKDVTVGVNDDSELSPAKFELSQNYPNPFNPSTTISFSIPVNGQVKLAVYNTLGQEVSTLVNSVKTAGSHSISFNANHLPSGIYIYRLESNSLNISKKMLLLK